MEVLPKVVSLFILDLRSIFVMPPGRSTWSFVLTSISGISLSDNFSIFNRFICRIRAYTVYLWCFAGTTQSVEGINSDEFHIL